MKILFSGELAFMNDPAPLTLDRWLTCYSISRYKPAGHGNGPVEGVKDGFEGLMVRISVPTLLRL